MISINQSLRERVESGQPLEYVIYDKIVGKNIVQWEADDRDRECIILCGPDAVDELLHEFPDAARGYKVPEVVFDLAIKMIKGEDAEPQVVEWGGNPVLIGDNGTVAVLTMNEGQS